MVAAGVNGNSVYVPVRTPATITLCIVLKYFCSVLESQNAISLFNYRIHSQLHYLSSCWECIQ